MTARFVSTPIARIAVVRDAAPPAGTVRKRAIPRQYRAKVFDASGYQRSRVEHADRAYVEAWCAEYFPGVPVEWSDAPAA